MTDRPALDLDAIEAQFGDRSLRCGICTQIRSDEHHDPDCPYVAVLALVAEVSALRAEDEELRVDNERLRRWNVALQARIADALALCDNPEPYMLQGRIATRNAIRAALEAK